MDGYSLVNILGAVLIVTSTMVVLAKNIKPAALCYALQSAVLVAMFITLGITTQSAELFEWAGTAFLTKVLVVPGIIIFLGNKIGDGLGTLEPKMTTARCLVLVAIEVFVCFGVIRGIELPTATVVQPALAISLAHFFIGLTCIISQRNIVKQIFGYCLMENGSHVTLALLAPQAPSLVEVGVATDAFLAVIIMAVVAWRIFSVAHTLDAEDLMELKG